MNKIFALCFVFMLFFLFAASSSASLVYDEVLDCIKKDEITEPKVSALYDFSDTDVLKIKISPVERIKSENDLNEGDIVRFRALEDVKYKKRMILKSGSVISARVETIVSSGMNGIPAEVIFGNFEAAGIDSKKINPFVSVKGQDRSLFVFPLKWALTPLPPTGSLTNFIKGGHVKLANNAVLTLFYYPNRK